MFDGYSLSTKDATHKKCSRKASETIEIKKKKLCVTDRNTSFNYENKGLAAKLRILGSRVFECPCDADTAIVKKALKSSKEQPVIVYADDTDILSLLLHLYHSTPDLKDIFLAEMTRPSATQMLFNQRSYQTVSKTRGPTLPYLLFAHAFTDCDMNSTYSAIYLLGKTSFSKSSNTQND